MAELEKKVEVTESGSHFPAASFEHEVGDGELAPYIDPVLEEKVLRKFDIWLLPQMMLLMMISFLDRSNIGNARVFGFEEGLGLIGHQFNDISTVFYATYVVCEVPWVMAVKRFGANYVLAAALVSWSIVTLGTGFIHNYKQAIAMRLLLGAAEAGLTPSLTFLQSTIWDRNSQAKRVSLLYASICISGAFGGLIAYGIQTMGDGRGLSAWRWLFIIEGIISLVICSIMFFTLPRNAESAWFLNEEERALMRARKARDIMFKGPDGFNWKFAKRAFTDPFVYLASALLFASSIPLFGFTTFLPTILKGLGHTGNSANYLSIPPYIFATITLLFWTTISDKLNKRALFAFIAPLPCILGYAVVVGTPNAVAGYVAMFLCAGGIYPYNAILLCWVSNTLAPDDKRSVGIPLFASLANISGAVASQIYPATDGPRYLKGNAISLSMETVACGGTLAIWILLSRRDKAKAKLEAEGVEDNGYAGEDRGLGFRYTL